MLSRKKQKLQLLHCRPGNICKLESNKNTQGTMIVFVTEKKIKHRKDEHYLLCRVCPLTWISLSNMTHSLDVLQ